MNRLFILYYSSYRLLLFSIISAIILLWFPISYNNDQTDVLNFSLLLRTITQSNRSNPIRGWSYIRNPIFYYSFPIYNNDQTNVLNFCLLQIPNPNAIRSNPIHVWSYIRIQTPNHPGETRGRVSLISRMNQGKEREP